MKLCDGEKVGGKRGRGGYRLAHTSRGNGIPGPSARSNPGTFGRTHTHTHLHTQQCARPLMQAPPHCGIHHCRVMRCCLRRHTHEHPHDKRGHLRRKRRVADCAEGEALPARRPVFGTISVRPWHPAHTVPTWGRVYTGCTTGSREKCAKTLAASPRNHHSSHAERKGQHQGQRFGCICGFLRPENTPQVGETVLRCSVGGKTRDRLADRGEMRGNKAGSPLRVQSAEPEAAPVCGMTQPRIHSSLYTLCG